MFFNYLFSCGFDLLLIQFIRTAQGSHDSSAGDHPLRPSPMITLPWVTDDTKAPVTNDDSTLHRAEETDMVNFSSREASANTEGASQGSPGGTREHLVEEEEST